MTKEEFEAVRIAIAQPTTGEIAFRWQLLKALWAIERALLEIV